MLSCIIHTAEAAEGQQALVLRRTAKFVQFLVPSHHSYGVGSSHNCCCNKLNEDGVLLVCNVAPTRRCGVQRS